MRFLYLVQESGDMRDRDGKANRAIFIDYFLATFASIYATFVPVFEIQVFALRL